MEREVGIRARCWQLPVLANDSITERHRMMVLDAPELAALLRPGQFVNVRCAEGMDPFLRRPLSVARMNREAGTISLLYEVVGRGTRAMADWSPGYVADVLGPLGNWFPIPEGDGALALVSGGIGVAPLLALAEELVPSGRPLQAFLGARTASLLLGEDLLNDLGVAVWVATDDGSRGFPGVVSHLLQSVLEAEGGTARRQFDAVLTCGPRPMMAAVCEVARAAGLPCFVSMEVGMACGFGVCMGCAWRVRPPAGADSQAPIYRLVCVDGPVFDGAEILWELPTPRPQWEGAAPAGASEDCCHDAPGEETPGA